ncbi:hypothetical protein MTR_6g048490 [Medicago truncatula]|uniref:Uncharacterized protein n=1 Tax=Medicago truncatula TaxID=3880 RepID=A0A072UK95_MEDTR|nr:hypothetical protein MTR_6g048490 [Medicago truncatula]
MSIANSTTKTHGGWIVLSIDVHRLSQPKAHERRRRHSEVAEVLAVWKDLEFAKDICFIAESNDSNVVLTLNTHQQSSTYISSIIKDCI